MSLFDSERSLEYLFAETLINFISHLFPGTLKSGGVAQLTREAASHLEATDDPVPAGYFPSLRGNVKN